MENHRWERNTLAVCGLLMIGGIGLVLLGEPCAGTGMLGVLGGIAVTFSKRSS